MPTLPENSVDMVLLDLPYGCISSAWDCKVDLTQLWTNLERICKPQAQIIMFCTTRFGWELIASKREWFRYDLVWEKGTAVGFLNCNKQPLRKHEMIYVFSKETGTYNPQKTLGHKTWNNYRPSRNTTDKCLPSHYGTALNVNTLNEDGSRYPTSIIFCQRDNTNKRIHPTMKPLELCRLLVRQYSNEGDVVLDCCMGSGTSVVAAKLENRKYIGIEMSEAFYKVASYRIDKSDTDPMALNMDTEIHAETTLLDTPDPAIIYCAYDTETGKKAEYKKKRASRKADTKEEVTIDGVPVVSFKTTRVKKVKEIDPSLPEGRPTSAGIYGKDGVISVDKRRIKKVKKEGDEPTTSSAHGIYGSDQKGVPRSTRKKKAIVIDPAFNEVEVEVENLKIEDTSVPCEVVSDIDELQMASLNGC